MSVTEHPSNHVPPGVSPLGSLPPTAAAHFRLHFFGAVLQLRERLRAFPPPDDPPQRLAFVGEYFAELEGLGHPATTIDRWRRAVGEWERGVPGHLPIRALCAAARLGEDDAALLFAIGLVDEDPRFGLFFDELQGASGRLRPTVGLLAGWWGQDGPGPVRAALRRLVDLGVCELVDGPVLQPDCTVQVAPVVWEILRGEPIGRLDGGRTHVPRGELTPIDELVAPQETIASVRALAALVDDDLRTIIVRGPRSSGRRTLLGALAHALGRGLLELRSADAESEIHRVDGVLATLLHALPVVELDLAPAQTAELAPPPALDTALGVVLGRQGGIGGDAVEASVTIALGLPDAAQRRRHWEAGLGPGASGTDLDELAIRLRMTGGNIRRTARLARAAVALGQDAGLSPADVRRASRALGRETLDALAVPVPPAGDRGRLAVDRRTREELELLELRCLHRERLEASSVIGANPGVRALFSGPSGTGKTLAARVLASTLDLDLYRVDLSTVVNKYIGETEKNLSRVFDRAEELDIALLLDEGDSLLTQRTDVQTAHDRYANLETNYLLQRLESFEGILIVTTNAADRIDTAFERRMDVVIDFRAPDAAERWAIWRLHLPPDHAVDDALLEDVALRCTFTGGQIRNAVQHATLLSIAGGALRSEHVAEAVRREYRKSGGVCPLRPAGSMTVAGGRG